MANVGTIADMRSFCAFFFSITFYTTLGSSFRVLVKSCSVLKVTIVQCVVVVSSCLGIEKTDRRISDLEQLGRFH